MSIIEILIALILIIIGVLFDVLCFFLQDIKKARRENERNNRIDN